MRTHTIIPCLTPEPSDLSNHQSSYLRTPFRPPIVSHELTGRDMLTMVLAFALLLASALSVGAQSTQPMFVGVYKYVAKVTLHTPRPILT